MVLVRFSFVLHLTILSCSAAKLDQSTRSIVTTNGLVKGKVVQATNGKLLDVFLGIPYAKPPLGQLRFQRPQPVESWTDTFDATTIPFDCPQAKVPAIPVTRKFGFLPPFTEDCLKLNVWVPKDMKEKLSTIVYIHPGGFASGGSRASLHDGSTLASEEDVIVVTFNYRVASIGFLYLDHPEVPGNAGLLDQVMAMTWVKENIANFGGDPEEITLMGQSAGAVSIIYHYISPLSQNLFKRGITHSGAPQNVFGLIDKELSMERAKTLGNFLDCPTGVENMTEFIRCLRETEADDLIASEPRPGVDTDNLVFFPIVDGYFFPESPLELLKQGKFKKGDLLSGSTKDDGSFFLLMFNPYVFNIFKIEPPITISDVTNNVRGKIDFTQESSDLLDTIYFGPDYSLQSNVTACIRMITDYVFTCPITDLNKQFASNQNNVYKYYYVHQPSLIKIPQWLGSFHGSELQYTLGEPIYNQKDFTKEETTFSRRLMRYLANFARTGNPNISPSEKTNPNYAHWPKFTLDTEEYLVLAPNSSAVGKKLRQKHCRFAEKVLPITQNKARRGKQNCSGERH